MSLVNCSATGMVTVLTGSMFFLLACDIHIFLYYATAVLFKYLYLYLGEYCTADHQNDLYSF